MKKKLMIVDGNSIINRAFYAIRVLTNSKGTPTNAIMGFLNIYFKNLEEIMPDYACVAFDVSKITFRNKMYSEYKAQRKGMPDELRVQMPILKDILKAMNVCILELEGYEADDIIGTVSKICEKEDVLCNIITGDKDDLQLASKNTSIYLTVSAKGVTTTTVYDDDAVFEKYGVTPSEFIDVKALMGDTSDNIPGVMGIGEKTALSLIASNKSIEAMYDNIENCGAKGKTLEKLISGKESAFLSKTLATIDTNSPIEFDFSDAIIREADKSKLYDILRELELKSIIKKLGLEEDLSNESKKISLPKDIKMHILDDEAQLEEAILKLSDVFLYRIYKFNSAVSAVAFCIGKDAYYVPCGMFISDYDILNCLKGVFENENIKKRSLGIKEDIVILNSFGIEYKNADFDLEIGAYILDASQSRYSVSSIAERFLNLDITDDEAFLGKGKSAVAICDTDENEAMKFACSQVYAIGLLVEPVLESLKNNNQLSLFYDIEMPLVHTLAYMQIYGMKIDRERLEEFQKELDERLGSITSVIYESAGEEFNINSPKQLGEILFEKLELPVVKKTKTGYSTDSEVLEKLKGKHEIIESIIEYRLVSKIKTTYADGLLAVINPRTGRIHSSFNQTVTVTGRISSTEPNMQNIPVRHELGREIRKMFVAEDGYVYVDADYSQIELRILAHIANDTEMIKAFADGVDIHTVTASQIMHISESEVTPKMRSDAKAVNFGIVYGIGEFSLAQDLSISLKEAKEYIKGYLNHYKGVASYMSEIKEKAKETGCVETLFARRRYIPELKSSNYNLRSFGERVALNTPIQGTAADIIKLAMVRVSNRLKDENLDARLVLQVHDELIVEANEKIQDKVRLILQQEMENVVDLSVKLVAEANAGKSWFDAK